MQAKKFGKTFSERVVELVRSIPKGRVTTYGDLARAACENRTLGGSQDSSRAFVRRSRDKRSDEWTASVRRGPSIASQSITNILGKACDRDIRDIPFHRIVYAGGKIWISEERRKERMKLYKKEGIKIDDKDRVVDFEDIRI